MTDMKCLVSGKQMDVGDALRLHVQTTLVPMVTRYFHEAVEAHVTFSKHGPFFHVDISTRPTRHLLLRSTAEDKNAYKAFDDALDSLETRLRRQSKRLHDHHKHRESLRTGYQVDQYVLSANEDDTPQGPLVIAEMKTDVPTLNVSQAVMHMDLAELPVLLFRNSAQDRLNVVYHRSDGNIGWIDLVESKKD